MKRLCVALVALLMFVVPGFAYRAVTACPSTVPIWAAGALGVDPVIDLNGNLCNNIGEATLYPTGAAPLVQSSTGTTAAVSVTFPAVVGKTNYLCGFNARSNATAAATGNLTVTGPTVTLNYTHWTSPLASGIGTTEPTFYPCIPATAPNTAIVITVPAAGAGGVSSLSASGYVQ